MSRVFRVIAVLAFTTLVFLIPIILFFVGTRETGINLRLALESTGTLANFNYLLTSDAGQAVDFRNSLYRSTFYSSIAALLGAIVAFFYVIWAAGLHRKLAVGLAFTLLTLTLLPQTYLIMPVVVLKQNFLLSLDIFLIVCILIIAGLPIIAWIFYLISGQRVSQIQESCALDHLSIMQTLKKIIREIQIEFIVVILLGWALAWSNYLIPYALGSSKSNTAVVQIATFTTNLGRDWASICAAGLIVTLPGVLIGLIFGILSFTKIMQRKI